MMRLTRFKTLTKHELRVKRVNLLIFDTNKADIALCGCAAIRQFLFLSMHEVAQMFILVAPEVALTWNFEIVRLQVKSHDFKVGLGVTEAL